MYSMCYVTAPTSAVAKQLARLLVQQHAAACVNIVPGITSIYTWQGSVHEDDECLLLVKTQTCCVADVVSLVRAHHPYECPEVVSVTMGEGSAPYLQWLREHTRPRHAHNNSNNNSNGGDGDVIDVGNCDRK